MIDIAQVQQLMDGNGVVLDDSGDKIGKIGQVFLDDVTGRPEWVTVKTGMFGASESFIPIADATVQGDDVRVPFSKTKVKDAPRVEADGHLSRDEEARLYEYYGIAYSTDDVESGYAAGEQRTTTDVDYSADEQRSATYTEGHDTSGPNTDDAMTRSEEQLRVGTEQVATGKARLRKYVVTENVTKTVPVRREEVRLEREPITDANRGAALSGADITEEEHEVTLSEERVVVDKEAVPVERVKLGTETVTDEQRVEEEVRKERIDFDDSDVTEGRRTNR